MGKDYKGVPCRDQYEIVLTYGDLHIPKHDRECCRILLDIIEDLQPDVIIDGGDLVNADSLSDWPKKPDALDTLQAELDEAFRWMLSVTIVSPKADRIVLRDNHFWGRMERKRTREFWLNSLRAVDTDSLLRLSDAGWRSAEMWIWKDTLIFVHGDDRRGSSDCPVNRVRKMMHSERASVVRFHTHVTGIEVHNHRGQETYAIQMGSLQDAQKAGYLKYGFSNWSQSAGVFYLSRERKEVLFVPILFSGRKAVFNGRLYS